MDRLICCWCDDVASRILFHEADDGGDPACRRHADTYGDMYTGIEYLSEGLR